MLARSTASIRPRRRSACGDAEQGRDGFSLAADISLKVAGADKAKVQALLEDAHTICPYSRATRGNVPVTLTVV